jgi:hypothetical protein
MRPGFINSFRPANFGQFVPTQYKWTLDQTSGPWSDAWNGSVLTATGSVTPNVVGKIDRAVTFAGGYLDSTILTTGPFSWNLWARRNANATADQFQYLMDNLNEAAPPSSGGGGTILLIDDDSSYRPFLTGAHSNLFANPGTSMTLGVWRMVTVTWSGTTLRLWVDNVLQTDSAATTQLVSSYPIRLGSSSRSGRFFAPSNVSIDDVRIYPYVLSPAQIAAIFSGGNAGASVDPVP